MPGFRVLVLAPVLLFLFGHAVAQPQKTPSKAAVGGEEAAVVEQIRTTVRFQSDGTGVVESFVRAKMQSAAGAQQYGLLSFSYLKDVERLDIVFVKVRKADGTVVETPTESIQDMAADISHDAPFFTALREKHVPVKALSAGDVRSTRCVKRLQRR